MHLGQLGEVAFDQRFYKPCPAASRRLILQSGAGAGSLTDNALDTDSCGTWDTDNREFYNDAGGKTAARASVIVTRPSSSADWRGRTHSEGSTMSGSPAPVSGKASVVEDDIFNDAQLDTDLETYSTCD